MTIEKRKTGRRPKKPSVFAKNLNNLLKERKITIREMSRRLGISASVLHGWTQGAVPNDTQLVLNLCKELEADFQFMMTGIPSRMVSIKQLEEVFHIEDSSVSGLFMIEAKRLKLRK